MQAATDAEAPTLGAVEAEIIAANASQTIEATFFRIGVVTTPVTFQGNAGLGGSENFDMEMNVEELTSGAQVSVETLDIVLPIGV